MKDNRFLKIQRDTKFNIDAEFNEGFKDYD